MADSTLTTAMKSVGEVIEYREELLNEYHSKKSCLYFTWKLV